MTDLTDHDRPCTAGALISRAATVQPTASRELQPQLQIGMGWLPQQTGGLNRYFYGLVHELSRLEPDIQSLVAGDPLGDGGSPSDDPVNVRCFAKRDAPLPKRLWAARQAIRTALATHPTLVASHFALYTLPALDLLRDVPLVAHFHGPWASEKQREGDRGISYRVKKHLEKTVYSRADRVITLSRAFANIAKEEYGVPETRLRVVPGGIETQQFDGVWTRNEAREYLGWPTDRPTVFCVRRLVPRMGIRDLISAVKQVLPSVPELQVMIGGKGPLAAQLADQIDALGLASHVKLLGFVSDEDLPIAYRAADVSIVPSDSLEGFGLIVAESLAAGTPALVTPVGGLPEVVRDLDADLVLETTGVEAIRDGLIRGLGTPWTLPSEQACRQYAQAKFDWRVIAQRIQDVYAEVV